ncbi:MAG: RNA polymerase sigma factor [Aurantibacter sp.]
MAPDENTGIKITEHLFRNFYQEVFSSLVIRFGTKHIELIEDALQESFYKALKSWNRDQYPESPKNWLFIVTKNHLINELRRNSKTVFREDLETLEILENNSHKERQDSQLRLLLACTRLKVSDQHKLIFTLKSICGFGVAEIAQGLLLTEDNVYKQLQRCKNKLKALPLKYFENLNISKISDADMAYLVTILYFMFNEGYDSVSVKSENPINKDICFEAVRLGHLLEARSKNQSAHHFLALCYFHMARFESRIDNEGNFVSLRRQDRTKWDTSLITTGFKFLKKPTHLDRFYVEALIASQHLRANSFEETDWAEILKLYETLLKMNDSDVIRLNRAICLFELGRNSEASQEFEKLKDSLEDNYLYYSVSMAEYLEGKDKELAKFWYQKSLGRTKQGFRKKIIARKLSKLN